MKSEIYEKMKMDIEANEKLKDRFLSMSNEQQREFIERLYKRIVYKHRFGRIFKNREKGSVNEELNESIRNTEFTNSNTEKMLNIKSMKFVVYLMVVVVIVLSAVTGRQFYQIKALTKQVKYLDSRTDDAEYSINKVERDIEEVRDNDSDLESRIDDLENRQIVVTYSR